MRTQTVPYPEWPETAVLDLDVAVEDFDATRAALKRSCGQAQSVALAQTVRFGDDPHRDAVVLRTLGALVSEFAQVDWQLRGTLPWPVRSVIHLPPPRPNGDPAVTRWRAVYEFGLCAYRRGPGFIKIRDVRPDGPKRWVTLPSDRMDAFTELTSTSHPPATGVAADLFDTLCGLALGLRVGTEHGVVLPIHAYRWPVPGRPGSLPRTGYAS